MKPVATIAPKEEEPKEVVKPVAVAKEEPKPAPVIIKKEEAKVATAAPVEAVKTETPKTVEATKETPKSAAPAVASGSGFKIQLGAFKSQAEADQNWARISSKHADILGGYAHLVVKADLPNGTYYRLRVSGYATADAAKQACAKLSARGQGCFFAGK